MLSQHFFESANHTRPVTLLLASHDETVQVDIKISGMEDASLVFQVATELQNTFHETPRVRGRHLLPHSFHDGVIGRRVTEKRIARRANNTCAISEKSIHISDMTYLAQNMKTAILARIDAGAQSKVWTPRDFLDLGMRDSVDKAMQRLTRTGDIRRVSRGLYYKPTFNDLIQKDNPPDPEQIIKAIARRDQIRILIDGMTAANNLGLTNAVPAKIVVHTEARLKPIMLDKLKITFKPTTPRKLYWAGRPAMQIVQALHWLRDTMGNIDDETILIRRLSTILQDPNSGNDLRVDLIAGLSMLPTWMQNMLRPILNEQTIT